jgi:hypothetical protein
MPNLSELKPMILVPLAAQAPVQGVGDCGCGAANGRGSGGGCDCGSASGCGAGSDELL